MSNNKKNTSKGKRITLIVLCCVLFLILAILITGTILLKGFLGRIDRIEETEAPTLSTQQIEDILKETQATEPDFTGEVIVDPEVPTEPVEVIVTGDNIINFLLVGQDRRPGEYRSRTDAMILVTVNKTAKTITMTSFLRDTWVKIPGYFNERLNVPYVLGGFPLLNKTLEYTFGITADHNVEVDFDGFQKAIELMGGVDIVLTADEASHLNGQNNAWTLQEGTNHLDGEQALAYSRIRYLDSDFGRTNRQRTVLTALINKAKTLGLTELVNLAYGLMPMVSTDMTDGEIISRVMELAPILPELQIVSQYIPAEDAYSFAWIDEKSVIYLNSANLEKNIQILKDTVGTE